MRHQLAPEAGRKGQRCLPSTQSRSGAENRLWFTRPSSPVLHVYLCAKMHFCIQHNRNRCGRFNINAVTNGRHPSFSALVCCGHYSELRSHFPCGCGSQCVFLWLRMCLPPPSVRFNFSLVISVFCWCRCPLCILFSLITKMEKTGVIR